VTELGEVFHVQRDRAHAMVAAGFVLHIRIGRRIFIIAPIDTDGTGGICRHIAPHPLLEHVCIAAGNLCKLASYAPLETRDRLAARVALLWPTKTVDDFLVIMPVGEPDCLEMEASHTGGRMTASGGRFLTRPGRMYPS
jgi:hypothetical protein